MPDALAAAIGSFGLDTVYAFDRDGFVKHVNVEGRRRRRLKVETAGAERELFANATRGALVRAFVALNMLAYSDGMGSTAAGLADASNESLSSYPAEQVAPIYDAGDFTYITKGEKVSANTAQGEAIPQWWQSYRAAYTADGQSLEYVQTPNVRAGELFKQSYGAFAMLYRDGAGNAVVVFRGSYSKGDFANIASFLAGWFADRAAYGMRKTWEFFSEENGLWGEAEAAREGYLSTLSRGLFVLGTSQQVGPLAPELHGRFPGVPEATFAKVGYWPMQKRLVDRMLDEDIPEGEKVYFSGQSQGGAVAALASMYVEKSRGVKIETITFNGVGAACWARELGWPDADGANLLDDVDPYVHHAQIADYADAYDVWGNMDVDPGDTCYYGVDKRRPAFKYCAPIQGYSGPALMVAQGARDAPFVTRSSPRSSPRSSRSAGCSRTGTPRRWRTWWIRAMAS